MVTLHDQQCLSDSLLHFDEGRELKLFYARRSSLTNWHFSAHCWTRERGVWLGLSDVDSPGKLFWVNGSEAEEGEDGQQPRSSIARGNVCVSFDQNGQTSSHLCDSKRAYVCQYNPQGMLTDTLWIYAKGRIQYKCKLPSLYKLMYIQCVQTPSISNLISLRVNQPFLKRFSFDLIFFLVISLSHHFPLC